MIYIKEENPPESIGFSFLKIHWLEPNLYQFKNWFQLKSSFPDWNPQEGKILVGTVFFNWNIFGSNQGTFKNEVPIDSQGFPPLI